MRAESYKALENIDKTISDYRKAVDLASEHRSRKDYRLTLCQTLVSAGRYREAADGENESPFHRDYKRE